MHSNVFGPSQSQQAASNVRMSSPGPPAAISRPANGLDAQLQDLERQITETKTEINSAMTQVKNGVTMRRKRELEEKLEQLEKDKGVMRSKVRATIGK